MTEPDPATVLELEPADLDGHSVLDLMAYADAGRVPIDPAIESSPACRNALAALERLRTITASLLDDADEDPVDETWVGTILSAINLDAHAGRDVPIAAAGHVTVVLTEGALKAVVRSAGDRIAGLLIGRIRIEGDVESTGPLTIGIDANIVQGYAIPAAVAALRSAVQEVLERHTRFVSPAIDVTIRDLHPRTPKGGDA